MRFRRRWRSPVAAREVDGGGAGGVDAEAVELQRRSEGDGGVIGGEVRRGEVAAVGGLDDGAQLRGAGFAGALGEDGLAGGLALDAEGPAEAGRGGRLAG